MDRPQHVRIAQKKDEEALFEHLKLLHQSNPLGFSFSEKKVRKLVQAMCRNLEGKIAGIIDGEDGDIAASVGIGFGQSFYSDDYYLNEIFLFVHPEYRGLKYHTDLKDFLLWYREKMINSENGKRLDLVTSCTSRERLDGKIRWWRTWSKQMGGVFVVSDNNRHLN